MTLSCCFLQFPRYRDYRVDVENDGRFCHLSSLLRWAAKSVSGEIVEGMRVKLKDLFEQMRIRYTRNFVTQVRGWFSYTWIAIYDRVSRITRTAVN